MGWDTSLWGGPLGHGPALAGPMQAPAEREGGRRAWSTLTDEGLKVRQPQGPGLTDHVGLAPAADARRAGFGRQPYAPAPPSPALPHKGGGELRAGFV